MRAVALTLAAFAALGLATNRALAGDDWPRDVRATFALGHADRHAEIHEVHHMHGRPWHGPHGPVVVVPRVVVPPPVYYPPTYYPPVYVPPRYRYYHDDGPATGFYYRGRGVSIGVGF